MELNMQGQVFVCLKRGCEIKLDLCTCIFVFRRNCDNFMFFKEDLPYYTVEYN